MITPESTERPEDNDRQTNWQFWMQVLDADPRKFNYTPEQIRDRLEIFVNPIVT